MKTAPSWAAYERLMARSYTREALACASRIRAALLDPSRTEEERASEAWHGALMLVVYRELAARYRARARARYRARARESAQKTRRAA